jgi:hypothetical protein
MIPLWTSREPIRAVGAALAIAILAVTITAGLVAAKRPAFFCELAPGNSYVTWQGEPRATLVEFAWSDQDGNVIARGTVIPTGHGPFTYKETTPPGATDFGVQYSDDSGVYAVGGMSCQGN